MSACVVDIVLDGRNQKFATKLAKMAEAGKLVSVEVGTITVACLPEATASGKEAVALLVPLPDGRTVMAVTTMRNFQTAAGAFRARQGDE